ncbi:hypothetical protein [Celeribacter sp.]|uniref:hypothetical protein n=1 Tax=Celeribacter sp. TaxID=1890673 RepID=UPI003A951424
MPLIVHRRGKADRQITDLFHFADLDRATDVILQKKDGLKHPRVVFFLPQAASGETGYLAQPLIVSVVVKPNGNFVSTFWRAGRRRWDRLVASEGVTVLKE